MTGVDIVDTIVTVVLVGAVTVMVPKAAWALVLFVFNNVRAAATCAAVTVVPSENL
jgi:hypothetical protein